MKILSNDMYLLLIDEEAEIKEGDIVYRDTGIVFKITNENISYYKEDIPKTVHKIYRCISYYPLTKEAEELDLPLLPPFQKEVDLDKLFDEEMKNIPFSRNNSDSFLGFKLGYKAAQSKQFSLEDMYRVAIKVANKVSRPKYGEIININEIVDTYIQSLSTQQLPKEFIPEYEDYEVLGERDEDGYPLWSKRLKTTINSEGKQELVGTYEY